MLKRNDGQAESRVFNFLIELLQKFIECFVVLHAGGDEQRVDARIRNNDWAVALHIRRARGGVALIKEVVKRAADGAGIGIFQRNQTNLAAERDSGNIK